MRALISVYDKVGVVEFAKGLEELGWELISTGGTLQHLLDHGLTVQNAADVTEFPEILGGRVKTLHPNIHGGILNRRDNESDQAQLEEHGIESIDMVVNTLYPFEATVLDKTASPQDIIEKIDIGGPSMIRAAAKNFNDVIIVTQPEDYDDILDALRNDQMDLYYRGQLAGKAFALTAYYDAQIANYFDIQNDVHYPEYLTLGYHLDSKLRYGENPHQKAVYYTNPLHSNFEINQLHGKQLSYNNYNDMKAALDLVKEFRDPTAVAVKHANPCGVAIGDTLAEAYKHAYESDPISIYGGIIALNRPVDRATAELLNETFLEIVIAPSFEEEAFKILTQKKNIRLIEVTNYDEFSGAYHTHRETVGGMLVQRRDAQLFDGEIELVTQKGATDDEKRDLIFAWKVAKHINSNAMVIAKNRVAIGLGHGEVRRVWALEKALERSLTDVKGAVVASDGFFFPDTIEVLKNAGIEVIIQPGGSIQDEAVIEAANKDDVSMYFTGMRHFKH